MTESIFPPPAEEPRRHMVHDTEGKELGCLMHGEEGVAILAVRVGRKWVPQVYEFKTDEDGSNPRLVHPEYPDDVIEIK